MGKNKRHCGYSWMIQWTLTTSLVISSLLVKATSAIKCYKCDREISNFHCVDEEQELSCPPRYDTCMTIVEYSDISEKMFITKRCSKKLSCALQVNQTRTSYPCDNSLPSWVCTDCCYEDLCNYNSGGKTSAHWLTLATGLSFFVTNLT